MKVAVVGAGAVGLSTALKTLLEIPNARVTIIADKFGSETTSSGAGGHFRPNVDNMEDALKNQVIKWCKTSGDHFFKLAASKESSTSGVMFMSGYLLLDRPEAGLLAETTFHFRELTKKEIAGQGFTNRYCYIYTTAIIVMKTYLQWLTDRITEKGGRLLKRKLFSFNELADDYDLIVNCSGLGSKELANDQGMYPVRGQLVMVKAPLIKHFYTSEVDGQTTYIYPNKDFVNLGGCRIKDDWNTEDDPDMIADIIRRSKKLLPALTDFEVVGTWAGLRPTRATVRVQRELLNVNGKRVHLIHNYGHGAMGITLSWGTATDAVNLLKETVGQRTSKL